MADTRITPQITPSIPSTVSEADFQRAVLDLAILCRWRVVHYRPALRAIQWHGQTKRYSTPLQGHPGAPDLILARDGRVILAELKSQRGRVSEAQRMWLSALGSHARLWRPSDWPEIVAELR